jgi:c-di-GMP-binding flagellar brake protein YcgR
MTWDGVQERRRGPRVAVDQAFDCRFEMRARVRLLDISASGALLATEVLLPADTAGRLKAVLAAARFSPSLEVRRTMAAPRDGGVQLGTLFLDMDHESRKSLDEFLKKATT